MNKEKLSKICLAGKYAAVAIVMGSISYSFIYLPYKHKQENNIKQRIIDKIDNLEKILN